MKGSITATHRYGVRLCCLCFSLRAFVYTLLLGNADMMALSAGTCGKWSYPITLEKSAVAAKMEFGVGVVHCFFIAFMRK